MRRPLYKRLRQLEVMSVRARAQREDNDAEADAQEAVEIMRLFMSCRGVEPLPQESIREASARALQITVDKLDEFLDSDFCPIENYLVRKDAEENAAAQAIGGVCS
jgi:hypothetical protein